MGSVSLLCTHVTFGEVQEPNVFSDILSVATIKVWIEWFFHDEEVWKCRELVLELNVNTEQGTAYDVINYRAELFAELEVQTPWDPSDMVNCLTCFVTPRILV